jgi:hypothetical protein
MSRLNIAMVLVSWVIIGTSIFPKNVPTSVAVINFISGSAIFLLTVLVEVTRKDKR